MNSKILRNTYLSLFAILYLCTAFVSTMHAIQFFSLANSVYLGIILALTFEVSQATVLSSLLIDKRNQKKPIPWILLFLMTIVQVLGNVYSSYKYICLNSLEDLKWFKEPIFIWMNDFPDKEATVIVTWAIGGLLPCVCLLLTEMVTSYIHSDKNNINQDDNKQLTIEDEPEESEGTEPTPQEQENTPVRNEEQENVDREVEGESNEDEEASVDVKNAEADSTDIQGANEAQPQNLEEQKTLEEKSRPHFVNLK